MAVRRASIRMAPTVTSSVTPRPICGAAADAIGQKRDVERLGQAQTLEQAAIDDRILGPRIDQGADRLAGDR